MKILGIDPGTRNCGYAIIDRVNGKNSLIEAGVIKLKQDDLKVQILEVASAFEDIFQIHKICKVAIETMFFSLNPQSVLKLAQFRGAILLKVLEQNAQVYEYAPLTVKKTLTGKARATKEQVAFMVKNILGIKGEIKPLDITDAIALALTCTFNLKDMN